MMSSSILSRFEGCLLGVLLGDVFGRPFEMIKYTEYHYDFVKNFLEMMQAEEAKEIHKFSDDSSMTMSLACSLIKYQGVVNSRDIAYRFVNRYFQDPKRGYGGTVISIFHSLRAKNIRDVFGPASAAFGGSGSIGNGAGMRISPIGLLRNEAFGVLVEDTVISSRITHSNPVGICGAIFQACAVRCALRIGLEHSETRPNPRDKIFKAVLSDVKDVDENKMNLAQDGMTHIAEGMGIYLDKLKIIEEFLQRGNKNVGPNEVIERLGVDVTSPESIPTAFYCFLSSFDDIPNIQTENKFQRCIQFAICLGGDTDTIASMAGSLCGAFWGKEIISENLMKHTEGTSTMLWIANRLHSLYMNS